MAQHDTAVRGAYILDPVAAISEHGHQEPVSLPVRHAEREASDAPALAAANFERDPTTRHETHPLDRGPKASEPARCAVAPSARVHRAKIIIIERPSWQRNLRRHGVSVDSPSRHHCVEVTFGLPGPNDPRGETSTRSVDIPVIDDAFRLGARLIASKQFFGDPFKEQLFTND